ncbi:MBL fold metallo-hydrolase [Acidisphaera rubrifaciens]|uniref:Beta-lactamase n=1 Tax=Acidisphaera rubrifaciens HS-AP3 TaxID=1231350 RepID=A0A0D6P5G3_9PROT|nr:MBL fold metallo-hydrolase [Acidisphaera rubrifaciens]GAN77010.1 beta-lactamase [Acidisphaera rubrifaciens HS-AP3]
MLKHGSLSRRQMLAGASIAAAGVAGLRVPAASAKMPMQTENAPYLYRFMLGKAEVTVVSDGVLPIGAPEGAFAHITKDEIDRELKENFLPLNNVVLEQNVLVLNTGDRVVLFDTGMGSVKLFGPTTGQLMKTLAAAGINGKDVDAVVMSHAHIDHCGGIMADDGTRNFPNAQLYISEADFNYWTDPQKVGPKLKPFLDQATKNLSPNKDRIHFYKDGEEFLPGIHAIADYGHTVGHTVFMIDQDGQQLCYTADMAHHPVLLLEHPRTQFAYDTDPAMAAESRVKVLDMLAHDRVPILAYHFPWPGIGHVEAEGDGYRFLPAPMHLGGAPAPI